MSEQKLIRSLEFGARLGYYRKLCGLTQEGLIKAMRDYGSPLSPSVYSKIETGEGNMYITDFVAALLVMKISFDEFFSDMVNDLIKSCR